MHRFHFTSALKRMAVTVKVSPGITLRALCTEGLAVSLILTRADSSITESCQPACGSPGSLTASGVLAWITALSVRLHASCCDSSWKRNRPHIPASYLALNSIV